MCKELQYSCYVSSPIVPLLPSNSVMLMPPPDEKNVTSLNEAVTSMASEKGNFK